MCCVVRTLLQAEPPARARVLVSRQFFSGLTNVTPGKTVVYRMSLRITQSK